MGKTAIVTVCVGSRYEEISELTYPSIKNYAKKLKAEFIVLTGNEDQKYWNKFKIHQLLGSYSRIIYVDTDLIIRDDCPDLFKIVPEDQLGIFEEGKYAPREEYIHAAMNIYNMQIDWDGQYFNTGVMVLSKKHRYIFKEPPENVKNPQQFQSNGFTYTFLGEQTFLNIVMQKELDIKKDFYSLGYKYNRMALMDEITGEPRYASYIIHYAGCPNHELMIDTIKGDKKQWMKDTPTYKYKKNIVISVSGGLGDQICTEPIARYAVEKQYPNDNVYITTHFPIIFRHLKVPVFLPNHLFDFSKGPYKVLQAYSTKNNPIEKIINSAFINVTDLSSMLVLKKMIPDKEKQIHLSPSIEGLNEVFSIVSQQKKQGLEDLILVHPGKGFKAKTFPIEWWNEIIVKLVNEGLNVGIIGKYISDIQGVLDVDIVENVIDFRDSLSLDGLMTLIGAAKILITNDSAPVHIAGAYDNWIILISSIKHPDHVLPWRNGDKYYKAKAIHKKLTVDIIDDNHRRIDEIDEDIESFLPKTNEIIDFVQDILKNKL